MYRPRSTPYGDIFTVPMGHLDAAANRLYAEQRQKEALQRQGDANLDNEFAKELVGIKKADIPEVTKAWNDFKIAHINNQKKGGKATPDDQYAVLQKKADFFSLVGASKEDKERLKARSAEIKTDKKGRYRLDSHGTLATLLNTPTSQRKVDMDDDLLYNQYSFPELPKVAANMMGKPTELRLPTGKPSSKGDLYDDEVVFQKFNTPNKMFENGFLEISTRPDRENYERVVLDSLDDKEKEDLTTRYFAKINSPEFKAIYGDVQPFPEAAEKTDLGKAVALSVMSAVDKLPLQPLKTESKLNTGAVMDKRRNESMVDWMKKNKITFNQSMQKIAANKTAGTPQEDLGYLSDNVAADVGEEVVAELNGNKTKRTVVYSDKVDPARLAIITANGKVKPIPIKQFDQNGKLVGIKKGYYVDPGTGDWEGMDGQKISRERVKDDYIKTVSPTKFKVQQGTKASENTKQSIKGW